MAITPETIGRYEILERLGAGGMAEVFKARYRSTHGFEKTLVLKCLLPELAHKAEFVDMFVTEARIMAQIEHPNVVHVLDFGEVNDRYFIAMEYVKGMDLKRVLALSVRRRRRPPTAVSVYIVSQVLKALDYAHKMTDAHGQPLNVVHRDISPSNIFISDLAEVKLSDFGIAKATMRTEKSQVGEIKGKYGYVAPEMIGGEAVDSRADLFSAGVVLAELLIVRRLFLGKTDLDTVLMLRDVRLDRLYDYGQHIPGDLMQILESALAKDPNTRYQDGAAFAEALRGFLFNRRLLVQDTDLKAFTESLLREPTPAEDAPAVEGALHASATEAPTIHAIPAPPQTAEQVPPQEPEQEPAQVSAQVVSASMSDSEYSLVRARLAERRRTASPPPFPGAPPPPLPDLALPAGPEAATKPLKVAGKPQQQPARLGGDDLEDALAAEEQPAAPVYRMGAPMTRAEAETMRLELQPSDSTVGRRRKITLTPPPRPVPVSVHLHQTGERARLSTEHALAAVRELESPRSTSRKMKISEQVSRSVKSGPVDLGQIAASRMTSSGDEDSRADRHGELAKTSLFRVFFELALAEETGLLVLRGEEDLVKEVFLVDGDPRLVSSNRPGELFGQFLVKEGVIDEQQLSLATAMLPYFKGRLGDSLVGLQLLSAIQVARYLTQQVRQKLLSTFLWTGGEYLFFRGRRCEQEAAPLGLDGFEVLGAASEAMPAEEAAVRLQPHLARTFAAVNPPAVPPEVFRLGSLSRRIYAQLAAQGESIGGVIERFGDDDEQRRATVSRVLFLLMETGLVAPVAA